MILEGIVTTTGDDGQANISPMGPRVDEGLQSFVLRPYRSSRTYRNLKRTGQGVLHVTDDVLLLARAAIGQLDPLPRLEKASAVEGWILPDACRWYAFRTETIDDRQDRTEIVARVVDQDRIRDFFGFNRAKHAVVEAAILATRTAFLPPDEIRADLARLKILVEKTGGPQEQQAFALLEAFVAENARAAEGS